MQSRSSAQQPVGCVLSLSDQDQTSPQPSHVSSPHRQLSTYRPAVGQALGNSNNRAFAPRLQLFCQRLCRRHKGLLPHRLHNYCCFRIANKLVIVRQKEGASPYFFWESQPPLSGGEHRPSLGLLRTPIFLYFFLLPYKSPSSVEGRAQTSFRFLRRTYVKHGVSALLVLPRLAASASGRCWYVGLK